MPLRPIVVSFLLPWRTIFPSSIPKLKLLGRSVVRKTGGYGHFSPEVAKGFWAFEVMFSGIFWVKACPAIVSVYPFVTLKFCFMINFSL